MTQAVIQADLIKFMRDELETRQMAYPVRVEMGRMSQKECDRGLELTRAVLEALTGESVQPAEGVLKSQPETDRYLAIEPILHQIHICAREHRAGCEHCNATAMALDEIFGIKEG